MRASQPSSEQLHSAAFAAHISLGPMRNSTAACSEEGGGTTELAADYHPPKQHAELAMTRLL
jgi:hypothetical protein